jgi:8-oxo-dGTP diphosphatase
MPNKKIEVVAAVIHFNGKYLCVQRPAHKYAYISEKWEFPGGKVEDGETMQEALVREIREELAMDIVVGDLLITVNHEYPDFTLIMHAFLVNVTNTAFLLNEHINAIWLSPTEMISLDWAAADVPIVQKLVANG